MNITDEIDKHGLRCCAHLHPHLAVKGAHHLIYLCLACYSEFGVSTKTGKVNTVQYHVRQVRLEEQ